LDVGVVGPDLRHRQVALEVAGIDDLDAVVEAGQDEWAMTIESIPLQSPYSHRMPLLYCLWGTISKMPLTLRE